MLERVVEFVLSILRIFQFWQVLDVDEKGFVQRLGRPVRDLDTGWNWLLPLCIERARLTHVTPYTDKLEPQSVMTADGRQIVIRLVITWHVVNVRSFFLNINDPTSAIDDVAAGAAAALISRSNVADVLSGTLRKNTLAFIKRRSRRYGIRVDDVQFADLTICESYRLFGMHGSALA